MSEILGTVLLTGISIVIAAGFGVVVFGVFSGASDTPHPTAAFTVDARPQLSFVDVTLREGSSFPIADARFSLLMNGTPLSAGSIAQPLVPGRFSPGDVMRFNLTSGTVAEGASFVFHAVDLESGEMIGYATASVPRAGDLPAFLANVPSTGSPSFSPTTVAADGATTTVVSIPISSSFGMGLLETVTANLTAVGGSAALPLNDAGVDGDAIAGDGVYSGRFSVSSSTLPSGTTAGSARVAVTVTDVFGNRATSPEGVLNLTASDILGILANYTAAMNSLIANSTAATNILGVGGISRNIPSSATIYDLKVTNFTFRDLSELDNDAILYRISDLQDTTKTWVAAIYFADCAASPYGGIKEIVMSRDGIAGRASYVPTSPTGCYPVDYDTVINLAEVNRSINATGASPVWTVTGNGSLYAYQAAGIDSINQGIVPFFGDTQPTADPHGSLDDLGLGTATVAWSTTPPPVARFAYTTTGLTVTVDASHTTGLPTSYSWTWGDGASSTGVTATHTYAAAGSYGVSLAASNSAGTGVIAHSVAVNGTSWPSCPPTSIAAGTLADCASMASASDAAASATLSETNLAGLRQASIEFTMAGAAEPTLSHTITARARQASGAAETLALQIKDPASGLWVTPPSFTWSTTTMTTTATPYVIPAGSAYWNGGAPMLRFVDANCAAADGACTGSDTNVATWQIDWVRVVSS